MSVLLLGPVTHWIKWELDPIADQAVGILECHAPVGARCRLGCAEGCEMWNIGGHHHPLVDLGECWVLPWFQNTDETMIELYDGPLVPLRDGPVTLTWFGEDEFSWEYEKQPRGVE